MMQLKKRADGRKHYRFMLTICFYQDARHDAPLRWMRTVLGIGYCSKRNDGMSELRINGYEQVRRILLRLKPYVRFKRRQLVYVLKASLILTKVKSRDLSSAQLKRLVAYMLAIQAENYSAHRKKTKDELYAVLDLTP